VTAVDLSIVVPAFDEAERLPRTLPSLVEWLEEQRKTFEIVVADDGSTDGTREVCERLSKEIPGLRVIGGPPNRGKGHAVRAGMLAATGAVRVMCDADGAMPPRELSRLLAPIAEGRAAIAIGSRYVEGRSPEGQRLWRRAWSRFSNAVIQRLLVPGVRDMHCGYKAFTAEAARELFSIARIDGWTFDIEILALASRLGLRVVEVGVEWHDDRGSRVRPARALASVLRETWVLRRNFARDVYGIAGRVGGAPQAGRIS
jgi:glycosyltransferase involved in cell wall biosynthesis